MNTWFISDTHFFHKNVLKYCNRPFRDADDMDEALIDNWNRKVRPTDTICHLGDFGLGPVEKLQKIFDRLNGHKHLIVGNHDREGMKISGWETITPYHEFRDPASGLFLVLCHYPLATWNHINRGSIMLHGHCHGRFDRYNTETMKRLDVGVDSFGYTPVSFSEIKKIMARKKKPQNY